MKIFKQLSESFPIILLIFGSFPVFSQNNLSLSGLLTDNHNEPVEAASVELLRQKDSVYVSGTVSDKNGMFVLKDLHPDKYILKATFIGYLPVNRNVTLTSDRLSTDLGRIGMTANDVLLAETVVEGKKPAVIVKNDTLEFDAASFKTPENAILEDLLKRIPGVEVDKDGKVTVNGLEIKKIKVDGKDFFSDDPQVTSKNLPAEIIDKLQVINEKSDMARVTGFDDGEESAIINLTIRQGMKKGLMGNALAGLGADINIDDDLRYQGTAFLNSMQNETRYTLILGRNNNNNMGAADLGAARFGGMRMRRGGGGGVATSNMLMASMNKEFSPVFNFNGDFRIMSADRLSIGKSESVTNRTGNDRQKDDFELQNEYVSNNFAANFTLEWNPDTLNTLTFRPSFGYNNSRSVERGTSTRYNLLDNDDLSDTIFNSQSNADSKGYGYDLNASLDYARRFSKPGRVFSVNLQGGYNASVSTEYSTTDYDNPTFLYRDLRRQDENNDRSANYRVAISYVEPLWKNTFLQASYRIAYNDTKGINSTFDINADRASQVDSLSRSTARNSVMQRIGLSLQFVRPKYSYTIGFNVDPSHSENKTYQPYKWQTLLDLPYMKGEHLTNVMGDSLFSNIPQTITNFSPTLSFNYNFGQRSNLHINYDGETNQPTARQLRDYTDMSSPTSWEKGNPHLKPGYSNNLHMRFQKYVPETQLMYNADFRGGFSINDIAATTEWQGDTIRITAYDNINGNWNLSLRGMLNVPLKNKKFSVGNFANFRLANQNSYIADRETKVRNAMKTLTINDRASVNYRSDLFDLGTELSVSYTHIASSIRKTDDKKTLNLSVGANTTWYLPYNITIDSDINHTRRSGSFAEYNIPETIWNASVTKQLFNKNYGAGSLKLQVYDILQNRSNITASATTNGYRISETNVIPSYFIGSFIYKFSVFPKSSSATESDVRGERRWMGGGRGQGSGGRPPF
ncbi:MAG: outer membrane beta-barrel protein [Dysgonamonadaceae bacterium]|jgi:hypothetical protein|nr:outer membrane beta-barrel protein [Dysgonamonadaceae bacterium]